MKFTAIGIGLSLFHRDATKERSIGGGVVFNTGECLPFTCNCKSFAMKNPSRTRISARTVRLVPYCGERSE